MKKKTKISKKLLYGLVIPLFAIMLVSAFVLVAYGSVSEVIEVKTPIEVSQEYTDSIETWLGEKTQVKGNPIVIENVADIGDIEVEISNEKDYVTEGAEILDVAYLAKLELYQKNTETWEEIEDPKEILYTVIGEEFIVENENSEMVINYIEPSDPYTGAFNLPEDIDSSFTGEKFWLVPSDSDGDEDNVLDSWSPESYYFEHDVVDYIKGDSGVITVPEGSSITLIPLYTIEVGKETTITITTTVNNVE